MNRKTNHKGRGLEGLMKLKTSERGINKVIELYGQKVMISNEMFEMKVCHCQF